MMHVQAIRKPRKTVKLYGRQFSTQQMGVQVPHCIHAKISWKDRLLGDAGGYPEHHSGFVQMERGSDIRRESDAGPYPFDGVDTAQVFGVKLHGVLERESAMMIFERHANLKYKYGNRHFWAIGNYVSTAGLQEKALRKYIQEQESRIR